MSFRLDIRNLDRGQVVEVTVHGDGPGDELRTRLLKLVRVRQPAELRLRASSVSGVAPFLASVRDALGECGGSLTVTDASPTEDSPVE